MADSTSWQTAGWFPSPHLKDDFPRSSPQSFAQLGTPPQANDHRARMNVFEEAAAQPDNSHAARASAFETPSTYAALTNDFAMSAFPASNNLPASAAAWDGALVTTAAQYSPTASAPTVTLPPVEHDNYTPTSIFSYSSTHAPFFPTAMQFAANIQISESSRTGYSPPQQPVNILTRQNTQDVAYYRNNIIGPGPNGLEYNGSENHYDRYNLAFDISSMDSQVRAPFLPY
jgi:hypothetical protein